jgi:hypothetical protein
MMRESKREAEMGNYQGVSKVGKYLLYSASETEAELKDLSSAPQPRLPGTRQNQLCMDAGHRGRCRINCEA